MSNIGIAVIGCGRWGPNHIRNFSSMPGSRVIACVDSDKAQLARISETFPSVAAFADVSAAFKNPVVDAVVIATPTSTHYGLVRRALKAGKHVLCEKPLCINTKQARELGALARKRKRVLMVGHVFLFNGGVVKLKELVDSKTLGPLHYLSAVRTNLGPIRSDVNAVYDLAAHDISIFNWLLGAVPVRASATGASFLRKGIEDVSFISLEYPGKIYANIHASWLNPKKVRQMIIVGGRKMVSWDDQDLSTPIAIYDKGANVDPSYYTYGEFLRVSMWDGEVRLPKVNLEEPLKTQDRYFLEAVRRGFLDKSNGDFAVGVVQALEAANRSIKLGGTPVRL